MKTVKSAFTIPPNLLNEAKQAAKDRGMNYSEFVVKCIEAVLYDRPVELGRGSVIPPSIVDEIAELRTAVEELSNRITAIEVKNHTGK